MLFAKPGRMREVANAPFLRRNSKDLASRRDHCPLAIGRNIEISNIFAGIHPVLHRIVVIAIYRDRQFRRLARLQVELIQVSGILKNNHVRTKAWPHDVVLIELSKLFYLLAAQIVAIKIKFVCRSAVGREINCVAMPHWKCVGILGVGNDLLHHIILDVINGNVLRHASGVALPLAEIAEDAVVSGLSAVRRK